MLVLYVETPPPGHVIHINHTTPRLRIPNGLLTSDQLYFMAEAMAKYGDDEEAVVDITTRQNLQLRGLKVSEWVGNETMGSGTVLLLSRLNL